MGLQRQCYRRPRIRGAPGMDNFFTKPKRTHWKAPPFHGAHPKLPSCGIMINNEETAQTTARRHHERAGIL